MSHLFVVHVNMRRVINFLITILVMSLHHHLSLFIQKFGDQRNCLVVLFDIMTVYLDDFNLYTWIYYIKHKYDVEQVFCNF